MQVIYRGVLAVSLGLLVVGRGPADDADTIKAVLDKGSKAIGGEEKITKYPGLLLKGSGKFYEGDKAIPFKGTWYTQGLDKSRTTTIVELKGFNSEEITVVNGAKGWVKATGDDAKELDKDALSEERENLYFNWVTSLVPLKAKEYKLTLLGDSKVNNKPAIGIAVASKGHRDVKLFFDKDSGLIVKAERKVRDLEGKKDVTEEVLFSDYKDIDGLKVAMKYQSKWDGKNHADADMTEAKVFEKIDAKWFEKP
jgi:hypothetical protein